MRLILEKQTEMADANTIDINVTSLLENADFLRYVLDADAGQRQQWHRFEQEHPCWQPAIERAKYILLHLDEMGSVLSEEEIESLRQRISSMLGE